VASGCGGPGQFLAVFVLVCWLLCKSFVSFSLCFGSGFCSKAYESRSGFL
jgi:hypothetical protein